MAYINGREDFAIQFVTAGSDCKEKHVIEVDELPTANIDGNALYKCDGTYYEVTMSFNDIIAVESLGGLVHSLLDDIPDGITAECYTIPEKTTDGVKVSDLETTYFFYYISAENDIFVYTGEWVRFADIDTDAGKFKGVISDISQATNGGYYALMTYTFKQLSGGGGGSMEGFHMVRFYNDDRTTLLYTVYVPHGSGAIYAGNTPISTVNESGIFAGFEPDAVNVTTDLDCYAIYDIIGTLDETTWAKISELSADGMAENYFAVGDTKMIHIEGTVGTLEVNGDYGVYIIGFNHNETIEGKGITFGTFKSAVSNGVDLCLVDSKYGTSKEDGTKLFSMHHFGNYSYGGWGGSDMRYDILGSTDNAPSGYGTSPTSSKKGNNPSSTCATNPVPNTLMSALPDDLRAVLKPMTIYTDNTGNKSTAASNVTATIDYLPLLAEFEIKGVCKEGNTEEQNKQKQYNYYANGNSVLKYTPSDMATAVNWITRTPDCSIVSYYVLINYLANVGGANAPRSYGLAPIFKV